jgi:hypothetical protein
MTFAVPVEDTILFWTPELDPAIAASRAFFVTSIVPE